MKSGLGIFAALLVGAFIGGFVAKMQSRAAVLSGPYSDNFGPALRAIADAETKLHSGNTNVFAELDTVQTQIKQAEAWTKQFLGQKWESK